MNKGRLEAFSDGVIAIIITIMVLGLQPPKGTELSALMPLVAGLSSYLLSFVYIGIYWNNHHHLLQVVQHVDGRILWANLHLLFWLSLVPFATNWMGTSHFATWPVAAYGIILLMAANAYWILTKALVTRHGPGSTLATALGRDLKGKISVGLYVLAVPLSFAARWLACAIYVAVAVIWLVPDQRIEKRVLDRPIE